MSDNKGTSEMPKPQVLDYNLLFKMTEKFIADLAGTIAELPYCEAKKFSDVVEKYVNVIPIGIVNELIRMISTIPYKYAAPIMHNIETAFNEYFVQVEIKNNEEKH